MGDHHLMLVPAADFKPPVIAALMPGFAAGLPDVPSQQFAVDSNVVIKLRGLREGKTVERGAELQAWLASTAVDKATFNPLPFAFESALQRPPTLTEFQEGFERGVAELKHALPGYAVVEYEGDRYLKVFEILQKVSRTFDDDMAFLRRIGPKLPDRKGAGKERPLEREIFAAAKECRISRNSPLVLAALSCLYADVHGERSAGAGVLKPTPRYSETQAYNALSDLRLLHMAAVSNHVLQPPVVFCTCDQPLVDFWLAIKPHVELDAAGKASIAFAPMDILFPRLAPEGVKQLGERINAGHDLA
jgi:hypothetical protein